MKQRFFICNNCGNLVAMVERSGVPMMCCGSEMQEIIPGTSDGAKEKHVPAFTIKDNIVEVTVGEVEHPMEKKHYIKWISIQTNKGNQRKTLKYDDEPKASFALLPDEKVEAVYAYCNLHSLWMAEA